MLQSVKTEAPDWRHESDGAGDWPFRKAPHSLEAEQALIGAVLIDNGVFARVAEIVQVDHFFDPVHRQIYETAGQMIEAGKRVTPITLKPFFENAEPIGDGTSIPAYLGQLAANAISVAGAADYGRTIAALAVRRGLILIGEDVANTAFDSPHDFDPAEQMAEAVHRIESLGSTVALARCDKLLPASNFAGKPIPPRVWQAGKLIPAGDATLLYGDGGTGKSLLAAQLGVATATGREWFGQKVRFGAVVYVGAEDDTDEMHRRLADICRAEKIGLERLSNLHLLPLAGRDAVLATADASNVLHPTPLWFRVRRDVCRLKPALVVYDTLADLFAGNENDRGQARQFVRMLRGLAIETGHAALLLAHPSLSGMASGSGTSGSTAWSNSVRSRLYLDRVRDEDGAEHDPKSRMLRVMKANYASTGDEIAMRWHEGTFVAEGAPGTESEILSVQDQRAENVFLDLLMAYRQRAVPVSANPCARTYAPTQFTRDETAKALGKKPKARLEAAMKRLFDSGRIRVIETGPPSKRVGYLEVV
jgi:RecA-family ATPase